MFKVTVEGKYVISGKLAQIDEYKETFDLAEGREAYARNIIQNSGILEERLRKTKKKFKRWQTCKVVDIKEVENKLDSDVDPELDALFGEAVDLACVPVDYKRLVKNEARKSTLKKAIKSKKARIAKAKAKKGGLKKMEAA